MTEKSENSKNLTENMIPLSMDNYHNLKIRLKNSKDELKHKWTKVLQNGLQICFTNLRTKKDIIFTDKTLPQETEMLNEYSRVQQNVDRIQINKMDPKYLEEEGLKGLDGNFESVFKKKKTTEISNIKPAPEAILTQTQQKPVISESKNEPKKVNENSNKNNDSQLLYLLNLLAKDTNFNLDENFEINIISKENFDLISKKEDPEDILKNLVDLNKDKILNQILENLKKYYI